MSEVAVKAQADIRHSSRAMRRTVTIGSIILVLIGTVLLYMLMQATNNRDLYERNYALLFSMFISLNCTFNQSPKC